MSLLTLSDCDYFLGTDKDELENYLQRQDTREKEFAAKRKTADDRGSMGINTTHSSRAESCSCIEGNPCMDRYGCKNWENRYEIAKKNGWKGNFSLVCLVKNYICMSFFEKKIYNQSLYACLFMAL